MYRVRFARDERREIGGEVRKGPRDERERLHSERLVSRVVTDRIRRAHLPRFRVWEPKGAGCRAHGNNYFTAM